MVGNCENMILISSATNNQIDEKGLMASTGRVMEKPAQDHNQQQLQQQQQALKCPRCDSSNTKFCYYNNYSLSQPRHFCKACKRYWTRGGTLRNVPVGGGCRKNKRLKKPAASADPPPPPVPSSATNPNANPSSNVRPHIDMSSTSTHHSPLFYGLPTNASHLNLPYPMLNSRVSGSGYDLQPQLNAPGLGFSSGLMAGTDHHVRNEDYRNGFNNNPTKQIQDVVTTSNPLLPSYSFLGSSPSPTMASLLASSLEQQKFMSAGGMKDVQTAANGFQGLAHHGSKNNQVKMEQTQNRLDWNVANSQNQSTHEQQISSSDPSSLYWNQISGSTVAWLDPANMGSSVPSLI